MKMEDEEYIALLLIKMKNWVREHDSNYQHYPKGGWGGEE